MTDQPDIKPLWPDPDVGPLRASVWFGRVDDRPAVVRVELSAMDLDRPAAIHAADVRLPLGRWLDAHVAMTRARGRASRQLYKHVPGHDKTVDAFEEQAGVAAIKNVGHPRERTDTFYREVAAIYNAAAADGDRSPAVRVEEQLGAGYASATARSWIRDARKRGFIAPVNRERREPA